MLVVESSYLFLDFSLFVQKSKGYYNFLNARDFLVNYSCELIRSAESECKQETQIRKSSARVIPWAGKVGALRTEARDTLVIQIREHTIDHPSNRIPARPSLEPPPRSVADLRCHLQPQSLTSGAGKAEKARERTQLFAFSPRSKIRANFSTLEKILHRAWV